MADEIIRELWQIKDDIGSKYNCDLKKLVKHLKAKDRSGKHEIVDLRSTKITDRPSDSSGLQGSASRSLAND